MGTLNVNAVPYPVSLGSNTQATFTVAIPAGSNITSGSWLCSGWDSSAGETQEIVTDPSGTNVLVINGLTAMTAGQIADFNAAVGGNLTGVAKYTHYEPLAQSVYITAELVGTFPGPPPPPSGSQAGTGSSGTIWLCLLNIADMRCQMGMQSTYVSKNISGLNTPLGVQILRVENASFLSITPGLINLNGAPGNVNCAMRIYKEVIAADQQWLQNPVHLAPPIHCQLAAMPVLIPWEGALNVFVEFELLASPAPANSSVEFSFAPILMRGGGVSPI